MAIEPGTRCRLLAATLCALGAWWVPTVHAAAVVSQVWGVTWHKPGGPPITGEITGEGGGGTLAINPDVPGATVSGSSTLTFEEAQGRMRSRNQVDVRLPGDGDWGDFAFVSINTIDLSDQLTVDHDGFGFMKILIRTTGNLAHDGRIVDPPNSYADISLFNAVQVDAAVTGGESGGFRSELLSRFDGYPGGVFEQDRSQAVYDFTELIVPWEDDQPIDFAFSYYEALQIIVSGVDAALADLSGENSFGHTLQLFADVYDAAGNLLQGVRVGSSAGIGYQSFGLVPTSSVPEPSSLALAGLGALALLVRRRRRG